MSSSLPQEKLVDDTVQKKNSLHATAHPLSSKSPTQLDDDDVVAPFDVCDDLSIQYLEDFIKNHPADVKSGRDNISRFHSRCQKQKIAFKVTATEVSKGSFTATAEFDNDKVTTDKVYPNKKAARDAVCKAAIDKLPKVPKPPMGQKRKASNVNSTDQPPKETQDTEDWISILNEYTQHAKISKPEYMQFVSETQPVPQFAYGVSIPDLSLRWPSDIASALLHGSRKAAKVAAAKCAVRTLREQGEVLPPGNKRKKSTGNKDNVKSSGNAAAPKKTKDESDIEHGPITTVQNLGQKIHELVMSLGMQAPRWYVQCSLPTSLEGGDSLPLWDIAAYFSQKDVKTFPKLAGPVGEVKRVYGQGNAKLASCALVLPLLEEIWAEKEAGRKS